MTWLQFARSFVHMPGNTQSLEVDTLVHVGCGVPCMHGVHACMHACVSHKQRGSYASKACMYAGIHACAFRACEDCNACQVCSHRSLCMPGFAPASAHAAVFTQGHMCTVESMVRIPVLVTRDFRLVCADAGIRKEL